MKRHLNFIAGKCWGKKKLSMTSLVKTRDDIHQFHIPEYRNPAYYCCPFIATHDMVASGLYWNYLSSLKAGGQPGKSLDMDVVRLTWMQF